MAEAQFSYGDYRTLDYTAGADIEGGDMVVIGSVAANTSGTGALLGIAHHPIANGDLGSLAIGGGVYDCMVADNYAAGTVVYKPAGNAILSSTGTNSAKFGITLEDSAAANAVVKVHHLPDPS